MSNECYSREYKANISISVRDKCSYCYNLHSLLVQLKKTPYIWYDHLQAFLEVIFLKVSNLRLLILIPWAK